MRNFFIAFAVAFACIFLTGCQATGHYDVSLGRVLIQAMPPAPQDGTVYSGYVYDGGYSSYNHGRYGDIDHDEESKTVSWDFQHRTNSGNSNSWSNSQQTRTAPVQTQRTNRVVRQPAITTSTSSSNSGRSYQNQSTSFRISGTRRSH